MRLRSLDGVRGVAILAVMANHTSVAGTHGGYLGVDVFFVLSGYLITSILIAERDRVGRVALGRFYVRRGLRLYPALLVTCGAVLALPTVFGYADAGSSAQSAAVSGTYMQDLALCFDWPGRGGALGHTWSLAVEEHFYLIWPPVLAFLLVRRWWAGVYLVLAAGIAWSVAAVAIWFRPVSVPPAAIYFRPDARAGELLVGVALAVWLHRRPFVPPALLGWAGFAGVIVTCAEAPEPDVRSAFWVALPIAVLASAALIADLVSAPERALSRVLSWRPLAFVGLISYGLYLYHPLVFHVVGAHGPSSRTLAAPIEVGAAIMIAVASWLWVELPFLRIKRKFASGSPYEHQRNVLSQRALARDGRSARPGRPGGVPRVGEYRPGVSDIKPSGAE